MRALVAMVVVGLALSTVAPVGGARTLAEDAPKYGYFIATGAPSSKFRATDRQLAEWALADWQRSVSGAFQLVPTAEDAALLRVYWADGDDGQYGEMRAFTAGDKRGAAVYVRPDTDALGQAIAARATRDPLFRDAIVYLTCVHELGHAFGLSHTSNFADIMYFFGYGAGDVVEYFARYRARIRSRDDIANASGLSDNDIKRIRALYAPR